MLWRLLVPEGFGPIEEVCIPLVDTDEVAGLEFERLAVLDSKQYEERARRRELAIGSDDRPSRDSRWVVPARPPAASPH